MPPKRKQKTNPPKKISQTDKKSTCLSTGAFLRAAGRRRQFVHSADDIATALRRSVSFPGSVTFRYAGGRWPLPVRARRGGYRYCPSPARYRSPAVILSKRSASKDPYPPKKRTDSSAPLRFAQNDIRLDGGLVGNSAQSPPCLKGGGSPTGEPGGYRTRAR